MTTILPNGQPFADTVLAAPYDGVDPKDGMVVYNPNFMAQFGTAHVFIITGTDPEPYGYFTISTLGRVPVGRRPTGILSAAWTNDDYANGYAIPAWPWHSLQQQKYSLDAQGSVSFRWDAVLQPGSIYSVHIFIGRKQ